MANTPWLFMLALGLATAVEFLENSMVVLSAAHIQGGVGATPEEFVWVTAAYAVAGILVILLQRRLAERLGYRRYLTLSLVLYALATVGCGSARGVTALIAARFVQGTGAGALFTSCRILLQISFTGPERAQAVRIFIASIFGASTLAPLLASFLIENYEWYWVFYALVPLIVACAALTYAAVPDQARREAAERRVEARARYDYWPVALFALGLVSAEIVLQRVRFQSLTDSPALLALLLFSGVAFAAFVRHQVRAPDPILHLRGLHNRQFLWGLLFYFCYYLLSYSFSYLFPVLCEQALGLSAQRTGLLLFLSGLVSLLSVLLYLSYNRHVRQRKVLMCAGLLCMGCAAFWLSRSAPDAPAASLYGPLAVRGLFGALLVLPVAGLTFQEFDQEFYGHAYRLKNILRQLCSTLAVAVMTVTLQHRAAVHRSDLAPSLSPADPAFARRLSALAGALVGHGYSAPDARGAALALIVRALDRQVLLLSCLDAFALIALIALAGFALMLWQNRLK